MLLPLKTVKEMYFSILCSFVTLSSFSIIKNCFIVPDQVEFVEGSIWSYPFKWFKGCLPQMLLGPFLDTLTTYLLLPVFIKSEMKLLQQNKSRSLGFTNQWWNLSFTRGNKLLKSSFLRISQYFSECVVSYK